MYFIFSAIVVLCDQLLKYWVTTNIQVGETMSLIPGLLSLTYVQNTGVAFSFLSDMRFLIIALVAVCLIALIIIMIKFKFSAFGMISLAAILGGALGNLIDRIVFGYVVDMFVIEFMNFAIFNIADIFITVGGIMFIIYYLFVYPRERRKIKTTVEEDVVQPKEDLFDQSDNDIKIYEMDIKTDWTESEILEEYWREQSGEDTTNEN